MTHFWRVGKKRLSFESWDNQYVFLVSKLEFLVLLSCACLCSAGGNLMRSLQTKTLVTKMKFELQLWKKVMMQRNSCVFFIKHCENNHANDNSMVKFKCSTTTRVAYFHNKINMTSLKWLIYAPIILFCKDLGVNIVLCLSYVQISVEGKRIVYENITVTLKKLIKN